MRKFLLVLFALTAFHASASDDILARVREYHGNVGPWAVTGYRIGDRALKELGLPRYSFRLRVRHRAPFEYQFSCVVDGLQAATGASLGKLNLAFEASTLDQTETLVSDEKTGKRLRFVLRPDFVASILNVPYPEHPAAAKRVAELRDDEIFTVGLTK